MAKPSELIQKISRSGYKKIPCPAVEFHDDIANAASGFTMTLHTQHMIKKIITIDQQNSSANYGIMNTEIFSISTFTYVCISI